MTPLQKLTKNVRDLGKLIVATCFELLPKEQKIAQYGHTDLLRYTEIKHSDWLKIVMGLGTANQCALFQGSVATLL